MTMVLGVPDIKRLEEGLERGCGGGCFRTKFGPLTASRYGIGFLCSERTEWLCDKILIPENRGLGKGSCGCPCLSMPPDIVLSRCLEMIRTGRTID